MLAAFNRDPVSIHRPLDLSVSANMFNYVGVMINEVFHASQFGVDAVCTHRTVTPPPPPPTPLPVGVKHLKTYSALITCHAQG